MTRIVEKVCTKTLFVMNYASLWERLSLYWNFMFTFLRKLKTYIHRWTSSEACKVMNLLLLDRWIQISIFKYLVEQSLKSLARNVTLSREHFDQHDFQHDEQFESRDLIILIQVDLNFFKLTQIFSNWLKFFKLTQIFSSWWLKFVQVDSSFFKLTQIFQVDSNFFKLMIQVFSSWFKFFKLTQIFSNWLKFFKLI